MKAQAAQSGGMTTIRENGLQLVAKGLTTMAEIVRITPGL